jgi:hypothetical protein
MQLIGTWLTLGIDASQPDSSPVPSSHQYRMYKLCKNSTTMCQRFDNDGSKTSTVWLLETNTVNFGTSGIPIIETISSLSIDSFLLVGEGLVG